MHGRELANQAHTRSQEQTMSWFPHYCYTNKPIEKSSVTAQLKHTTFVTPDREHFQFHTSEQQLPNESRAAMKTN